MDNVFTGTMGTGRKLQINNERILYMEQFGEMRAPDERYLITFDNGATLELEGGTGRMFYDDLGYVHRAQPATQYIRSESPKPRIPFRQRADG